MKKTTASFLPNRRLVHRIRCFHRLSPEEVMVRKGF
jgi:hypothetical protein